MLNRIELVERWTDTSKPFKAACFVAGGFLLLRLGYSPNFRSVLVTLGLTIIEIGSFVYLDAAAKVHHANKQAWLERCGDRAHREAKLEATKRETCALRKAIRDTEIDLKNSANAIQLRHFHYFDIAVVAATALAMGLEAYRAAITANVMKLSVGAGKPIV